jgi:radical SAM superfamily enzyme YgiQ (UPF0313 family)
MEHVLLINPPQSFERKRTSEGLAPPLGLLYLKAMLPDRYVRILDLSASNVPMQALATTVASDDWDVVGITVLTYCLDSVRRLVEYIKGHGNPYLIGGGAHATLVPDECLRMGFDAVVVGEGERVISDLMDTKPRGVLRGVAVQHLDALPYPDRSCLDSATYGVFGFLKLRGLSTSIMTSRGCPYTCRFCGRIVKGSVRRRSVASVIAELRALQRRGFENIFIADDHFITDKRWVAAFCHALKREQLQFNFFYQTRIDTFDEASAEALRDTGTQYISFGIESIHPPILQFYGKTRTPSKWRDLTRKALQLCTDTGIYSQASLIIGAPMETEELFWESYDFVMAHGADTVNVNPLTYLVASEIWQDAVERGVIRRDEYLVSVSERALCPIPPQRIAEICDEVFHQVTRNIVRRVLFKTLRHLDGFRLNLLSRGVKEWISWTLLGGDWRRHYDSLREFGYGKRASSPRPSAATPNT